jgi:hypothetical protein
MSDGAEMMKLGGFSGLKTGQRVGPSRFTLIKELGRGGMGVVWLAQDTSLEEQVALKFLPPEVAADPVALNDLRRETVRSHRLTHPNIIRLHDFHQQPDGVAFISMEYVDGQTLSGWRLQQPQQVFAWEQLAPLVTQFCTALEYAHGEGVIHRDLKPANVMLDSKGRVKLADFGIAAVVSDSVSRVSVRSSTGGTLAYMSPQQLRGQRPTVSDDVYALGASLYELLTGRPPFCSGDITHQVLHEPAMPLAERLLDLGVDNPVPEAVAALIMACLAKEPEHRPQSAQAVAEWIASPAGGRPTVQAVVELPPVSGAPGRRKGLWIAAGVSGLVVLLLLATALFWRPGWAARRPHPTGADGSPHEGAGADSKLLHTPELAMRPALPFAGTLRGTIWKVTDSDGDTAWFEFGANGRLTYQAGRGIRPNGTWEQNGTGLSLDINDGFTLLTGTISGNKMAGKALSLTGANWTWEATPKN